MNLLEVDSRTLHLETIRLPSTTSLLELTTLGLDSRLNSIVSMRVSDRSAVAEVSNALTGILGTSEKNSARTLRSAESKLVECKALATGLNDSSSSGLGETKCADS
jgi:hypothetical protein